MISTPDRDRDVHCFGPGGLGGVGIVLISIIAGLVTLGQPTIGAAVLIHRAATYLFPTVVGGGVAAGIASR